MSVIGQRLPPGWAQSSLRDVLLFTSTTNPKKIEEGEFFYIGIEALDNQRQRITAPKRLPNASAPSRARNAVRVGDVIFSLVRPYLKNVAIIPDMLDSIVASTAFFVCRPGRGVDSRFLLNFLRQESFIASITTYGSSPPAARDEEFERLPILVAPSAEQERIADALDELLSDLDAGVAALMRVREKLKLYRVRRWIETRAATSAGQYNISLGVLQELIVPLPPLAEQQAIVEAVEDQLSVIDHLETDLYTKLKTAQALRQSILRHAFTGQLVPQDLNDEPASELLKRIAAEREARNRKAVATKRRSAAKKTHRHSRASGNPERRP